MHPSSDGNWRTAVPRPAYMPREERDLHFNVGQQREVLSLAAASQHEAQTSKNCIATEIVTPVPKGWPLLPMPPVP
ncbi:hypothetical protein HYFRA_00008516 [Hymenoscyphus fraxineus]|uniref:Uncharacterized protein n=1 Tax=Hymenoscyphus fraxineus TaxID=746836 RepID=A0A9N9PPN2_9HELO|nr:hypothetical protein HYFRA_00008516 [Hymenoscyphus fraxineus]